MEQKNIHAEEKIFNDLNDFLEAENILKVGCKVSKELANELGAFEETAMNIEDIQSELSDEK